MVVSPHLVHAREDIRRRQRVLDPRPLYVRRVRVAQHVLEVGATPGHPAAVEWCQRVDAVAFVLEMLEVTPDAPEGITGAEEPVGQRLHGIGVDGIAEFGRQTIEDVSQHSLAVLFTGRVGREVTISVLSDEALVFVRGVVRPMLR